jgi:hypothetical protein
MTSPDTNPGSDSLRSDEPIRRADQDKLTRAHLVEVIAAHIMGANAPESVVVAMGKGRGDLLAENVVTEDYRQTR